MLATADSASLILWNTGDWSKWHNLTLEADSLDFDPTGRFVVGCCRYQRGSNPPRAATIIDTHAATVVREVAVDGYRIAHARFSPDGHYLACAMRTDTEKYSSTNVSALIHIETGTTVDRPQSRL